jgi:putative ATPase subunit of terminase (gpP-like)
MNELTNIQKKDWARMLFLKENLTQGEIAERVGVARATINRWAQAEKWEEQKVGLTLTRETQVASLYRQVAEINRAIMEKPEGQRFADSKEADILGKLSSAIRKLENEVGISETISVLTHFIEWLKSLDMAKAKELVQLADAFIRNSL